MGLWEGEAGQAGEGSSPGPATFAFPQQSEVQSNPLTPFSHSELLSADHHSPWGGSKLQAGDGSTMALNALGFVHVCLRTGGALGTGALSVAKPLGASWC